VHVCERKHFKIMFVILKEVSTIHNKHESYIDVHRTKIHLAI
jgi:hypothetical protein